jgi:hypothetical protein
LYETSDFEEQDQRDEVIVAAETAWEDPSDEWADNVLESADPPQLTDPRDVEHEPSDPSSIDD